MGFIAVPARTAPLLVILTFSLLLFLAFRASLLGIPLGLLLLTGFFNYTFVLMDSAINGDAEPPVLSMEMMNPLSTPRSLLLLALVLVVFFTSRAAAYWLGAGFAVVAAIGCAAVVPALLSVQAITGSTPQGLSLPTALRLIGRLGADYATVVLFILAAGLIGMYVGSLSALPLALRIAVLMYFWLASFCLIGGILRERADDIGLGDAWTPQPVEDPGNDERDRQRTRLVDRIYAEWRGGAHANAWQSVMGHVGQGPDALVELEWLYERVALARSATGEPVGARNPAAVARRPAQWPGRRHGAGAVALRSGIPLAIEQRSAADRQAGARCGRSPHGAGSAA